MTENKTHNKIHKGIIKNVDQVGLNLYEIGIEVEDFAAKPGQFVSVYCDNCTLRRPFSVYKYKENELCILFKLKGKGTEYLKSLNPGENIDFSGPFGNGFILPDKFSKTRSLLVGAGVGIAPIVFLRDYLIENRYGTPRTIGGFLNESSIPDSLKNSLDFISTDCGDFGKKGSIIDYLEQEIQNCKPDIIYACGPSIVLQRICEIASKFEVPTQVAIEKEMACSIGVCRGCVIKLKNGKTAAVCKDGPVFYGEDIEW